MQGSATPPSTPKYQQFRANRGIQLSTTTEEGDQGISSSLAELEVEEVEEVEGVTSEGRLQVGAAAEAAVAAAEAAVAAAEAAVGEGESPGREP